MNLEQRLRHDLDDMSKKCATLQRIAEDYRKRLEESERKLRIYRAQLSKSTLRRLEKQVGCFGCESGWSAAYYHTCKDGPRRPVCPDCNASVCLCFAEDQDGDQ